MAEEMKKFLDQKGIEYLWSKINMQDYPNNDTLVAIINAIDAGKMDKTTAIPLIEQAIAGQMPVVKTIDENGKPIEWEAKSFPDHIKTIYIQDNSAYPGGNANILAYDTEKILKGAEIVKIFRQYGLDEIPLIIRCIGRPQAGLTDVFPKTWKIQSIDGGYILRVHYGDNYADLLFNNVDDSIIVDPDWIAPTTIPDTSDPHQQLITNENGEKVWMERPFYDYEERTSLLPENTYSGKQVTLDISAGEPIYRGMELSEYSVIVDGIEYRLNGKFDSTTYRVGNASLAGLGEDTGEPFLIANIAYNKAPTIYFQTEGEHTLTIDGISKIYKTLPEEYLKYKPLAGKIIHITMNSISYLLKKSFSGQDLRKAFATRQEYPVSINLSYSNDGGGTTTDRELQKSFIDREGLDGGFRYWLYFGDDLAPYIIDVNADTMVVDSNWVAPNPTPDTKESHKYLTTNGEGEKVWEEKLAYTVEEEIIFMAESTYEFSGSSISISGVSGLELGTTYTVRCDNTEYQTTFLPWDETNNTFGTLGNRSLAGQGEDTGEPFYLSINPALGFGSMSFYTGGSHTISITGSTFTHRQVPQKYIAGIIEGTGKNSVVMNYGTPEQATGIFSFAEGGGTKAVGNFSHAEGDDTIANGPYSHAEGVGTIASNHSQHVQGRYNVEDTDKKYLHIVGNGNYSSDGTELIRSNAHTLDQEGNAWFAGTVKVGGTSQDDANAKDVILAPTTASTGQTIVVKAVDDNSKPTEWEAVDTLPECSTAHQQLVTDANGNMQWEDRMGYSSIESVELCPLTNVTVTKQPTLACYWSMNIVDVALIENALYDITFDGANYRCAPCKDSVGFSYLGNPSLWNGDSNTGNGEPFAIRFVSTKGTLIVSNEGTYSIKVVGPAEVHHKIPGEYTGFYHSDNGAISNRNNYLSSLGKNSFSIGGLAGGELSFAHNGSTSGMYAAALNNSTADSDYQFTCGKNNLVDTDNKYIVIAGNGKSARSNAHTLDWEGNAWFSGNIKVGGTGQDDKNAKTVATQEYVDEQVNNTVTNLNNSYAKRTLLEGFDLKISDGWSYSGDFDVSRIEFYDNDNLVGTASPTTMSYSSGYRFNYFQNTQEVWNNMEQYKCLIYDTQGTQVTPENFLYSAYWVGNILCTSFEGERLVPLTSFDVNNPYGRKIAGEIEAIKLLMEANYTEFLDIVNANYTDILDIIDTPKNYIILNSSTPNSTKKFKLTIDDDGIISTEEVVE